VVAAGPQYGCSSSAVRREQAPSNSVGRAVITGCSHSCLNATISGFQVYCARYPTVSLGEEFEKDGQRSLQVCYLQHAYGSGEHYNSVAPIDVSLDGLSASELHSCVTVTA
jgi:hypothetical protein